MKNINIKNKSDQAKAKAKTINGALQNEFESAFEPKDIEYDREIKFYKWLRDNKL